MGLLDGLRGELEMIQVLDPGTETYTDTDGIVKERALNPIPVENVDIQPTGGSSRLLPEGVRATATHQAFVDMNLSDDEAAKVREAIVAGRHIQDASGKKYTIAWVGDWGTHLVLALTWSS